MAKIIIEIDDELKKDFVVKCATKEESQKDVLTELIKKWTEKK